MSDFTPDELARYARHFSLLDVGRDGQRKLKNAKVLAIGAGGLANPALLYLAAAGVGTLGIVDADVVDSSNLQRQILFTTKDLGEFKVTICQQRLQELNPYVDVKIYREYLTDNNAREIIKHYDIVLDCSDNFPTRYLVNDACWHLNKPNIYASISQFEGQCTVFTAEGGPCYRCLYAAAPPAGLLPNCAEGGVLGALPGLLGSLQAMQALNLILGLGKPLVGRLLMIDALDFHINELIITRDSDCVLCGQQTSFEHLARPQAACAMTINDDVPQISSAELQQLQATESVFILDVRQLHEYEVVNMGGYLIPLNELESRLAEIDTIRPIIVHCKAGMRSAKAVQLLQKANISARSLTGGIDAWLGFLSKK